MKNIILGDGQIGKALSKTIPSNIMLTKRDLDFSDPRVFHIQLKSVLDSQKIGSIINAVAYTNVDGAEKEKDLAMNVNANSVKILAEYATKRNVPFIHYSTDFVFNGQKNSPYTENDAPDPINHYGNSKYIGEKYVIESCKTSIILRISWVYSVFFETNFVLKIISALEKNKKINVVDDQIGSPCNAFDVANETLKVLNRIPNWSMIFPNKFSRIQSIQNPFGLYHLAPQEFVSRFNFAKKILEFCSEYDIFNTDDIVISPSKTVYTNPEIAKRPLNSALDSTKIANKMDIKMLGWEDSLRNAIIKIANFRYK